MQPLVPAEHEAALRRRQPRLLRLLRHLHAEGQPERRHSRNDGGEAPPGRQRNHHHRESNFPN